jgi:hypothetical protein
MSEKKEQKRLEVAKPEPTKVEPKTADSSGLKADRAKREMPSARETGKPTEKSNEAKTPDVNRLKEVRSKPSEAKQDKINLIDADRLAAAHKGTKEHSLYSEALKKAGEMGGGWRVLGINETMGGKRRPDVVYINDTQKRVLVEDLYTGSKRDLQTASGPESKSHNDKGWSYSNEPKIAAKISEGYRYDYAVLVSKLEQ